MAHAGGRPPKWTSVEAMQEAIDAYFESCKGEPVIIDGEPFLDKFGNVVLMNQKPPTVTGLALALGFYGRQELLNYVGKKEFSDTVRRAKAKCEEYAESRLYDRDGQRGAAFSLKCNFKWREEQKEESINAGSGGGIIVIPALIPSEDGGTHG